MEKKIPTNRLTYGRGCVYYIKYHLVWRVKYRHSVSTDKMEPFLKQDILTSAKDLGIIVDEIEVMPDHIHLLISCSPRDNLANIIKVLKGNSARRIFVKYPELKSKLWDGHLWNPSYFIATVSDITEDQIKTYINEQKIK